MNHQDSTTTQHNTALCWINGTQVAPENASLSLFDHGLLYGDGVFEGIRFYNREPFLLEEHLTRLAESAQGIEINIPYTQNQLAKTLIALCQKTEFSSGYIRLVVTRGVGELGLNPEGCGPATVFIILAELTMMPPQATTQGITTIIAKTRRISPNALNPKIKSLNYLNNIIAKQEANKAGVNEAILLNDEGNIAEAVAENVFIVSDGTLITPPCSDGALDGITKTTVLALAKEMNIASCIQSITVDDLLKADEVFLTGTGAGLVPVRSINSKQVKQCPGEVFQQLNKRYRRMTSSC